MLRHVPVVIAIRGLPLDARKMRFSTGWNFPQVLPALSPDMSYTYHDKSLDLALKAWNLYRFPAQFSQDVQSKH